MKTTDSRPGPEPEHCARCGRPLRCATSRARGYGWGCWARIRRARRLAALVSYTRQQIDAALELIEDCGIVRLYAAGAYRAVNSDGTATYLVHAAGCTCPAGLSGRACYHRAAALMVTA